MTTNAQPRRVANVAPLMLRLAVAGIFFFAAERTRSFDRTPVEPIAPNLPNEQPHAVDPATVGDTDLQMNLNSGALTEKSSAPTWRQLTAVGEYAIATVMFLGFFTRLIAVIGLGAVAFSALAFNDMVASPGATDHLVGMYASNPMAMLLLGAVFLSLLFSGCGPLGLDRRLFGRRLPTEEETA